MTVKLTTRPLGLLVIAAATSMAFPAGTHRANGEIIGIVESGSSRVANAVVNLTEVAGSFQPPSEAVVMDQKDKEFLPHVLAIMKGTRVRFSNSDPFFHNVFSSSRVKTFNVSQEKKGDASTITFDKPGLVPIRCHIHAAMRAVIDVLPNPFFDVTNEKGQFHIADVPPGTYTIKVWSEGAGSSTQSIEVTSSGRAKVIFKI